MTGIRQSRKHFTKRHAERVGDLVQHVDRHILLLFQNLRAVRRRDAEPRGQLLILQMLICEDRPQAETQQVTGARRGHFRIA